MLEIELVEKPETCIDVFDATPSRVAGLSTDDIQRLPVYLGNQSVELGQLFSVTGDASDLQQVWRGDLDTVNGIGHQLDVGHIQIEGSAGHHIGSRMSGGTIQTTGSVGDHAGSEMAGGTIHVRGNAGDLTGAAYAGGKHGQNGGVILIDGSAGNSTGKLMRRGIIAVRGDAGNCCGFLMKAGTIVVCGQVKKNAGLEMVRGTIVLGHGPDAIPAGFLAAGRHQMPVTALLDQFLNDIGFANSLSRQQFDLYHGDQLQGGRGEMLVAPAE
ncbi:MAG: formylmethanofuran dehydrogenase subunit C [Pirellulaceae bacterium]